MSKQKKFCVICKTQPALRGAYLKACKPCYKKMSDGISNWMSKGK